MSLWASYIAYAESRMEESKTPQGRKKELRYMTLDHLILVVAIVALAVAADTALILLAALLLRPPPNFRVHLVDVCSWLVSIPIGLALAAATGYAVAALAIWIAGGPLVSGESSAGFDDHARIVASGIVFNSLIGHLVSAQGAFGEVARQLNAQEAGQEKRIEW